MENSLNELDSARESADVIDVNKEVVLDAELVNSNAMLLSSN